VEEIPAKPHISLVQLNKVSNTYGKLTHEELKAISQKSVAVLKEMGPEIEWIQSYVTGDKIFCVYKAENEELIRNHAKKGGFPANKIMEIHTGISPATALDN
jgi:hypothetical protein